MSIPLKKPTDDIKDITLRDHIEHLQQEALGNILELAAAPTAPAPLLTDNEIGIYNNSLYVRQGNIIYVFTSDSQITIS